MQSISLLLYKLGLHTYYLMVRIAALFNEKASAWYDGRKNQIVQNEPEPVIWFHCASLGEYEQAKPVIKAVKHSFPNSRVVVTFFSPSGYEVCKDAPLVNKVYYLPHDFARSAREFVQKINPRIAIFVKYDLWYNYLEELNRREIPSYLISATFREGQVFFRFYGGLFRQMLAYLTGIFVQKETDLKLLNGIGLKNVTVSGDTRFDTVMQTKQKNQIYPIINDFVHGDRCIVAGSTWLKDEKYLARSIDSFENHKLIVAPHNINSGRISELEKLFPNAAYYSRPESFDPEKSVLIIDNYGMLRSLYKYADWVYIGGGFGTSIHNILEAAVFGKATVFGPNHTKMKEAIDLIGIGGAFTFSDLEQFKELIRYLQINSNATKAGKLAASYVEDRAGATDKIIEVLTKDQAI